MPADESRPAAASGAPLPPVFQPLQPEDPAEVGGYRLHARLGAGGMGRVYLSYTPGGRPVALKVVRPELAEDPEFRRRFAQEVANAQRIHGLYTAQVIDSGTDADAPWLVTAYVAGPSLQQVVREHGALPVGTVLLLMGGIAEALQAIHHVQIVHRDLKPANVLVASDGPRVIDFGIARAADATALTGTGFRIGSPAFMAPEQARGRTATPSTDVFALGALAAYAASGVPPFGEGPETAVLYRVVHEQPQLDGVPGDLRDLVLRCLAKSPEDRPQPAEIIEIASNHPEVGGQLRFADDWLPSPVTTDITRRADLPRTPPARLPEAPPAPTVPPADAPTALTHAPPSQPAAGLAAPPADSFGPPPPASEAPTGPVPSGPATRRLPEESLFHTPPPGPVVTPADAPRPGKRAKGVSWKALLTVALVMALGGTVGGVVLVKQLDNGGKTGTAAAGSTPPASPTTDQSEQPPATDSSASPSAADGASSEAPSASESATAQPAKYVVGYQDQVLSIPPNGQYQFDLKNGKVVPDGSADWELGTLGPAFQLGDQSDAYISRDSGALTPEQCSAGIDRAPASDLKFDNLPAGRYFCVRSRSSGSIVVLRVVTTGNGDGSATCSLTSYRNDA